MLSPVCRLTVLPLCLAFAVLVPRAEGGGPLDEGSTLCLHPVEIPIPDRDGEARRASLEQRLRDALVAASFTVPDPPKVVELSEQVEQDMGGYVDVATGYRDEARYRAFREQRAAVLRRELGCDAELSANVVQVRARFTDGAASWDGATDSVSSTGRVVLNALGGVSESGWVAALSLWLRAYDLEDTDLAFRSAGIETLVSMAVLREQDVLPKDLWLTNVEKLDAAIASALGVKGLALRREGRPFGFAAAVPNPDVQEMQQHIARQPSGSP